MYPNLKAEMARKGLSVHNVAQILGIQDRTLNDKLDGKRDFKIGEILKLKEIFGVSMDYLFEKKEAV